MSIGMKCHMIKIHRQIFRDTLDSAKKVSRMLFLYVLALLSILLGTFFSKRKFNFDLQR